jgi:hypothetical protein
VIIYQTMTVKKSVLEAKSNQELEEYIKEGNRFVPEAKIYAYEILKSRGREFSEVETERFLRLIAEVNKSKETTIHPNHKKAGNLIYLSGGVGFVNAILSPVPFNTSGIFIAVFALGLLFGMGYLVSKGHDWLKYVLLVLMIFGLMGFPILLSNLLYNPVVGIINIIQTILQLYALVLLFRIRLD